MTRRNACFFGGLVVGGLVAAAGWLYSQRPRERIPSLEGIDDPEVARGFNRVARMPHMRFLRWFVARRAVGMVWQGQAADLGCGPGFLVLELTKQSPQLHVTGIDLSDEMLTEAETITRGSGASHRVSFKKGDAEEIPLEDGSMDLVVSTLSLHHWGDPVAVLNEIARVLRPGGSFLIFDLRRDMVAPTWLLIWFATHVVVLSALRQVNEPLASRDAAYTPEEAAQLAEQSRLTGWSVTRSPLWLTLEGTVK